MATKHDEIVDPGQPALILMHGDSVRKQRALTRDAITIGRAHGCDICLEAPDVSGLHCVISRRGAVLYVRDCGSRSGTHLNGEPIRETTVLRDDDILQVGPFSYRVHVPGAAAERLSQEHRGERSRRNLVRIALGLRRRLREARSGEWARELEQRQAQFVQRAATLEERAREYELRFARLDQAERELNREREALQQASRELEAQRSRGQNGVPESSGRQLNDITRGFQAMQLEHQENMKSREEWAKEQAEASARLAQQRAALTQAEASLREQRAELSRMIAELKQLQDAIRSQQNADVENLRRENEQLHQLLAERDQERVEAAEATGADAGSVPEHRAEIELLRQLLQEKDALLEEHRKPAAEAPQPISDVDAYEAELIEFKRQLEDERKSLNKEIEQLRVRNAEMDEATREMELELSRERAELARERQRLDRMREDTRLELEKVQREASVRDRLAPVFKLREEIAGGSSHG